MTRALPMIVALAAVSVVDIARAHPLCYLDDSNPSDSIESVYCDNKEPDGFCCDAEVEAGLQTTVEGSGATDDCADLYKEVMCAICHPYSAHLFERLNTPDGLTMTIEFCDTFLAACSEQLNLPDDYCEEQTGGGEDQFWSYPLVLDESFDDSGLIKAFSSLDDSELPTSPIDMHMTPDGTKWWIAGLEGQITEVDSVDPGDAKVVLDIGDKIELSYEEGLLGFALSPSFHDTGVFYVSYCTPGTSFAQNRLSRFVYDSSSAGATAESEEILITTSEKESTVHSAGWVGFKPSDYVDPTGSHDLYWTVGDGGPQNDPFDRAQDTEMYHGSMIRISVSSTLGSGYDIPSDNPFADGGGLGEICAWGMRNPFRCSFDTDTDDLYCGDVGHLTIESVNLIECGKNYGWRRFEAERCMLEIEDDFPEACDAVDRSPYTFPIFNYCHPSYFPADHENHLVDQDVCGDRSILGSAIIGGKMYRGSKYGDLLGGNYIFAEFTVPGIYHMYPNGDGTWGSGIILNDDVPDIVSFGEDNEGELYIISYEGTVYDLPCGNLCGGEGATPFTTEPVSPPTPDNSPEEEEEGGQPSPTTSSSFTMAPIIAKEEPSEKTPSPTAIEAEMTFAPRGSDDDYVAPPIRTETAQPASGDDGGGGGDGDKEKAPTPAPVKGDSPPVASDDEDNGGGDKVPERCSPVGDDVVPMQDAPKEVTPEYLGCYLDSKAEVSDRILQLAFMESVTMTHAMCEEFCRISGGDMFGVQFGRQCMCGDSRDADIEKHGVGTCILPCAGDPSTICGGYLGADVYFMGGGPPVPVDSEYLGCMRDEKHSAYARALFEGMLVCTGTMTTQICEKFCREKGAVVYGLQFGNECFCGNEFDHDQYGPGICNLRCAGDDHATCGGYLSQNVYALK